MKRLLLLLLIPLASAQYAPPSGGGYALPILGPFAVAPAGPAASTTHYFGLSTNSFANMTTEGSTRITPPRAGTIQAACMYFNTTGTLATTETSTIAIFLNNTTATMISSTVNLSTATPAAFCGTGLNVTVNGTTDYFEIRWITPAWVTPPTGVRVSGTVWLSVP